MLTRLPLVALLALSVVGGSCFAQTVVDDFESPPFGGSYPVDLWGQFGPLTTDAGYEPFECGDNNICLFHTLDASLDGWGVVDLSPLIDLSAFGGFQFDARILTDTGDGPLFVGETLLDAGLEFEQDESLERYAAPVTLSDSFQTFTVNFRDIVPRPGQPDYVAAYSDLSDVQLKFRFLALESTGVARLEFDNIVGLDPTPFPGDFNDDGAVDAADYTVWRDNLNAADEGPISGNGDGLNGVDQADYLVWEGAFGATASATSIAVPEPTSLVVALVLTAGCTACRKRHLV